MSAFRPSVRREPKATGTHPSGGVLQASSVAKAFGGVQAVSKISIACSAGERLAVIGPNGAGKSTLFSILAGQLAPDHGTVTFDGKRIDGLGCDEVCRRGLARTFQIPRPFSGLTVEDNLLAAAYLRHRGRSAALKEARRIAARFDFTTRLSILSRDLNEVDQKRLELARAYATAPRMLLLDEVGAGLTESEGQSLASLVMELNEAEGITILFVEHVMSLVSALAHRVVVVDQGAVLAAGTVAEIMKNQAVIAAYLGEDNADGH